MLRGTVNARYEAVLNLRVRGPAGAQIDVAAVIDTAFTASLTLPLATVAALGLAQRGSVPTVLADGTFRSLDTYDAEVEWDGVWRGVLVTEVDTNPLIGTTLLAGHEAYIEFVPGGAVDITKLP